MPKIPDELPVYGGSGELLFQAQGQQIAELINSSQVRPVGSCSTIHALYWLDDAGDNTHLALARPPVGQRTTWREPVGDTKVYAHRMAVCLNWGTV